MIRAFKFGREIEKEETFRLEREPEIKIPKFESASSINRKKVRYFKLQPIKQYSDLVFTTADEKSKCFTRVHNWRMPTLQSRDLKTTQFVGMRRQTAHSSFGCSRNFDPLRGLVIQDRWRGPRC